MVAEYNVPASHNGPTINSFLSLLWHPLKNHSFQTLALVGLYTNLSMCSHAVVPEFHFLVLIHASMARPRTPCVNCVVRFPWTPSALGYLFLFFFGLDTLLP